MIGLFLFASVLLSVDAGTVLVDKKTRNDYIAQADVWFPDQESLISTRDMYNGPPNPYNLKTQQTILCDFVEPSVEDPIGGTTPKFYCAYKFNGEVINLKIKYDQQYNSALKNWGRPNEEVYASVVSQRLLWGMGFGADHSIPVNVQCRNCPVEPWTYIQMIQGYDSEDVMSGWMDMELVKSGEWNKKLPLITFSSAIVYIKWDKYLDGDAIDYLDAKNVSQPGFNWNELFIYPNYAHNDAQNTQTIARSALSVIAAFISHCDNFDGNQGFICLNGESSSTTTASDLQMTKTKSSCKGKPFVYIHDVGGTLGYGWNLRHKNFWPNYFDLKQWHELSVWGDAQYCKVHINGLPGCSWTGDMLVSEEGRALASRLLSQFTHSQILDLFTAARASFMRKDSVEDWVAGFFDKLQRDIQSISCDN